MPTQRCGQISGDHLGILSHYFRARLEQRARGIVIVMVLTLEGMESV